MLNRGIDSPLLGVNTPRSDEDRLKLIELMVFLMKKDVCDEIGLNAACLSKLLLSGKYAAEGFEQIIDFLSGSYINHALTVNPHVYISCIKQIWNTALVKRSGDITRVEGLKNDKAAQQLEIVKLKVRVKKLEKINKGRIIVDMDQDEGIELVADQEKDAEVEGRHADKQAEIYDIDLDHSSKVLSMQEDDTELRRLRKVGASRRVESSDDIEDVFNHGRMINEDEGIELVKDAEIAESEGRQADK
nr:hypothetical protein [Tanacetum cinerariifolium]